MSVKESRKASLLVQFFEYLKLVDESEVLVGRPNEGIRSSLGLAMISGEKPRNRLEQRSIDSPVSAKWTATSEDSSSRLDKSSAGTR